MEKETLLKNLGARIREIRNKKGISQKQLAHSIGKDQQSVQRLEAGNINPTYYYLSEIADGLEVDLEVLIKRDGANSNV
ncbi:helix-turn-helix domain-containing protein [Pedobacter cryoconitis]|uniref:Helix-turn-helix protein n=1 Tax=Pedobacter cryoconitis TaxID=188932 RepID=A0A327S221_9SPHI|nr:helix-turn-helix transcriptional regulator [Pedobacter cryoconitis]RAJ23136.1 helix-turn-helix protein [Pedobacter cryoconitis]